jgi:ABC-type nickel/cobalt efflux system permease component RcnA
MVITITGHALFLVISGTPTFATPAIGRAYLAVNKAVTEVDCGLAVTATFMLGILLALVGNVLLGVAVWRSGTLPRWAEAIWAASALMFYVLGAVLGQATTGSSPVTQPVGASLMVISGGWIAWRVMRQPSTQVGTEAEPRVQ